MNALKIINELHHKSLNGELPVPISQAIELSKDLLKSILLPIARIKGVKNFYNREIQELLDGKSIALVGNSPILDDSGYGNDIDSHDMVIRMNAGIIESKLNNQHTGVKTDIWATGAISCVGNKDIQQDLKDSYDGKNVMLGVRDLSGKNVSHPLYYFMISRFLKGKTLYYCPGDFHDNLKLELFNDIFSKNKPSLGCIMLHYIIQHINYKKLSLYGFSFSSEHRISEPMPYSTHDFPREEELARKKIDQHDNIHLYQ